MTAQFWLTWCGTALAAVAMAYSVTALLAMRLRRGAAQSGRPMSLPAVTVLKPLCGAERDLYDCLRSFCNQCYPCFQTLFGVREADDPAMAVVRRLQREFPGLDLQIAVNPAQHGSSGKVSNLINMMPFARHDYLVIADSDVRVAPDYLARVIPPLLDAAVGIVTCPYRGCPRRGAWSRAGGCVRKRLVHALRVRGSPARLARVRLGRNDCHAPGGAGPHRRIYAPWPISWRMTTGLAS